MNCQFIDLPMQVKNVLGRWSWLAALLQVQRCVKPINGKNVCQSVLVSWVPEIICVLIPTHSCLNGGDVADGEFFALADKDLGL